MARIWLPPEAGGEELEKASCLSQTAAPAVILADNTEENQADARDFEIFATPLTTETEKLSLIRSKLARWLSFNSACF